MYILWGYPFICEIFHAFHIQISKMLVEFNISYEREGVNEYFLNF